MFSSLFLMLLLLALTFACIAYGAEPVRREAAPAPNGGRISATPTADGEHIIETWSDGTVTTNVLRKANTKPEAVPIIASELQKAVIVAAALSRHDGNLLLAAEEAQTVLSERERGDIMEPPGNVIGGGGLDTGIVNEKGRELTTP